MTGRERKKEGGGGEGGGGGVGGRRKLPPAGSFSNSHNGWDGAGLPLRAHYSIKGGWNMMEEPSQPPPRVNTHRKLNAEAEARSAR